MVKSNLKQNAKYNQNNEVSNRELRYYKRNFKKEFNTNLNKNVMEKKLTHYIKYLIGRSDYFENYSWVSYNSYNDLIHYTNFLENYYGPNEGPEEENNSSI